MYLKSIEVHGFKSFANKIVFSFHNGITGIVGPNGSGKSNVADAVRWVLGEQRAKQLRGSSMQDVIFSGTEMRKPMGYAYVSITLDNSDHALSTDFDEVTVSRRVYRSGESEYLINGSPCRLKDINELFYDTGIGKEGYSIIGQGQIDKILSGKPEERRELFDEAAGIVKFKRRKDTAAKKLESERANLVRVNDILSELEKQVGPLERQSEVAKDYLKKKEELKSLDINLFLLQTKDVSDKLKDLDEKLEVANKDLNDSNEALEKIKNEYSFVEEKIQELDEAIENKRTSLSQNSVLREKLEGEIRVLEEKINSIKINEGHIVERENGLKAELESKNSERNTLLEDKEKIDISIETLSKEKDDTSLRLKSIQDEIAEITANIEKGNNDLIKTLNDRTIIKTKLGQVETLVSQLNIRKAEFQSKLLTAKSEEAEQTKATENLVKDLNDINAKILEADKNAEHLSEQLYLIRRELEEKDTTLIDAQSFCNKEQSRLEALKNITERYDGYGHSVKSVMENKADNKGLLGVVADIITTDKKYETAIETALGGNIQNIVTSDEATAKEMIAFLKKNKAGRATFLPLTSVRNRGEYKYKEIKNEKGFVGFATELVKADSKYNDVVSFLLGEIVIIDNVDNALKIAKDYNYKLRLVTVEGEYLTPGGALAGGSFKSSSNFLGRRREIEEIETRVKEAQENILNIKADIDSTKLKRDDLKGQLEDLKAYQQELYIAQNTAQVNVDNANSRIEETRKGYNSLLSENEEIESRVLQLNVDKNSASDELKASESFEKETEVTIKELGEKLDKLRDEESRCVILLSDLNLKYSNLSQSVDFKNQSIARVDSEIEKISTDINELLTRKTSDNEDEETARNSIEELKKTIDASVSSKSDDEEELKKAVKEKEEFSEKQKTFFERRESLAEKSSALDKEVYRLTSNKDKLEESQQSIVGYMFNEYGITLSQAEELRDENLLDITVIRRDIGALKDAIRRLGNVNVNAIEDYKVLMERYTFLKTQHDDLIKAEESLVGIIEELDNSMRKQFTEKFEEIGKEYDKVFKEMFGGGKGSLELEQDADVLEAGIKIIAQPPGKKLQNMMQLSGGEKALTAIALLFAIQNLKPSPFCLLDEIEAALDESNVSRFAGYLHKLTKYTQFIVITHRRGTMEEADRLYGITMQEKGVSALVSVDLIDSQLSN